MVDVLIFVVDKFLWWAGMIIHTAAKAFGCVPGLGSALRKASDEFDKFSARANTSLDNLKSKTVSVKVNLLPTPTGSAPPPFDLYP